MTTNHLGFSAAERATFKRLRTPEKIQRFLDEDVGYDLGRGGARCRSPRIVLRERLAACVDGALFAAAALRMNGFPPLLVDLEAERDDDHVLAVFRRHGLWGALAKSNYAGLRYREPVYRSVRELVMSYFEHYYNLRGEKSLRRYSRPVNLRRFDSIHWMTADTDVWAVPHYLCEITHAPLLPQAVARKLTRMDKRLFAAGLVGRAE